MNVDALRKQQDIDHAADLGGRAYQNGVEWHENPYPVIPISTKPGLMGGDWNEIIGRVYEYITAIGQDNLHRE